jgi:hypothetical protein
MPNRPHSTTEPFAKAPDDLLAADVASSAPSTIEDIGSAPEPESTILPDILDESSFVFRAPVQVLVGNQISSHLSRAFNWKILDGNHRKIGRLGSLS